MPSPARARASSRAWLEGSGAADSGGRLTVRFGPASGALRTAGRLALVANVRLPPAPGRFLAGRGASGSVAWDARIFGLVALAARFAVPAALVAPPAFVFFGFSVPSPVVRFLVANATSLVLPDTSAGRRWKGR